MNFYVPYPISFLSSNRCKMWMLLAALLLSSTNASISQQCSNLDKAYVSEKGNNDICCGSENAPCSSLSKAISRISSGGTVYLLPGTFSLLGEDLSLGGSSVIISSTLPSSPSKTIVDCGGDICLKADCSTQKCSPETTLTLVGFTVRNGKGSSGGCLSVVGQGLSLQNMSFTECIATSEGGAISLTNSAVSMASTSIQSSSTSGESLGGGAIFISNSTLKASALTVASCSANDSSGGAIYSTESTISLTEYSSITRCTAAVANPDFGGGGIYSINSKISASLFTIQESQAYFGGCWSDKGSDISLLLTTFNSCSARFQLDSSAGAFSASYSKSFSFINSKVVNCSSSLDGGAFLLSYVDNVTITDSRILKNSGKSNGAGINAEYCTISITNTLFSENYLREAPYGIGGGMYVLNTYLSILDSNFTNNGLESLSDAQFQAGGALSFNVYVLDTALGSLYIQGTTFKGNQAQNGGALHKVTVTEETIADYKAIVNDSFFIGNKALQSGGAAVALSSIKFVGCHFENNTSERSGGAFSSQVENEPSVLEDCTFKRNTASTGNGGAVEIPKGGKTYIQIRNSRFIENSAVLGFGGGLYTAGWDALVNDSTFIGNKAGISGGGVEVEGSLDSADKPSIQARFYNCSFESNYSPVGGGGIHGTAASTASFRNSTFYNNNSTLGGALFLSQVSEFQLYGCTCDSNVAYHGGGCLLLQDEAKLIMADTVINNNNASSEGGAVKLLGTTSLNLNRCTVSSNLALVGGAIWAEVQSTLSVRNSYFTSNKATFQGGAIYQTHQTTTSFRSTVFAYNTAPLGSAISIDSYSALSAFASEWLSNIGTAISLKGSAETNLTACRMSNNIATLTNGGAIWATDSTSLIIQGKSSLLTNSAPSGGALYADGSSKISVSDSLFDSNSADEGGAFLAFGNVQLSVSSNLFTRNRASESGGALALTGAVSGVLQNSTFENCQAGKDGAGVYLKRSYGEKNSIPLISCLNLKFNKTEAPRSQGTAFFDASFYPRLRVRCQKCVAVTATDTFGTVPAIFRYIWPGQVDSAVGKKFRVLASSGDPIVSLQIQILDGYGREMVADNISTASITPTPRISGLLTGTARAGVVTLPPVEVEVQSNDLADITLELSLSSPSNSFPPIIRSLQVGFCPSGSYYNSDAFECNICPIGHWCEGGQPTQYCPDGTFSFQLGSTSPANCTGCAGGLECGKGNGTILKGFWLDPSSLPLRPAVYGCDQSRGCSGFQFLGEVVEQCKKGYKDRVCSACTEGFYGFLTTCSRCTPLYKSTFAVVVAVVLCLWLVLNWLSSHSAGVHIVISEMQFLAILGSFNLNYFGGTWIASIFQVFNLVLFFPDFLGPECVNGKYTFAERWAFTAALPVAGTLFYVFLFLLNGSRNFLADSFSKLSFLKSKRNYKEQKRALLRSLLNLLDLLYISVAIRCFQAFHSQKYDKRVLSADPTITWLSSTHVKILPFAVIYTGLFVIGLPMYFSWLLYDGHSKRLLHEKEYLEKYGTLYERYEPEMYWWYLPMVWGRRLAYAAILVFWSAHPDMQAYICFLVILILGLTHYFIRPHKSAALDILLGLLLLAQYLYLLAGTANSYMTNYVAGDPSKAVAGTGLILYMLAAILMIIFEAQRLWAKFWVHQWALTNGDEDNPFPGQKQPQFSLAKIFKKSKKASEGSENGDGSSSLQEDDLVPLEEITAWFNPVVLKAFLEYATISELNLLQMVRVTYSYHVPSREEIRQAGRILDCLPKSLKFSFINELLIDMEVDQVTPSTMTSSLLSDRSLTPSSTKTPGVGSGSGSTSFSGMSLEKIQSVAVSASATATLQKVYGMQRIRELRNLTIAAASDKRRAGDTLRLMISPRHVEVLTAWLLFDELEGRVALKELLTKFSQWLLVLPHEPGTFSKVVGSDKPAGAFENKMRRFWRRLHLKLSM